MRTAESVRHPARYLSWLGLAVCWLLACGDGGEADASAQPGADDVDAGNDSGMPPANASEKTDVGPWLRFAERPCPSDNQLSWENFGAGFVLAYCTGCHGRDVREDARQGAPLSITFDDPNSIRDLDERIWSRAADGNATMPPVGGPDLEARRKLGQWLACGAPVRTQL